MEIFNDEIGQHAIKLLGRLGHQMDRLIKLEELIAGFVSLYSRLLFHERKMQEREEGIHTNRLFFTKLMSMKLLIKLCWSPEYQKFVHVLA